MKNNLKLSTRFQSDDQDDIYNNCTDLKCSSICAGCHNPINDQYLLKTSPELEWHVQCLKCFDCGQYLEEKTTCFVVDGKILCKYDYIRLFASQCAKCHELFSENEFFIRTTSHRRFHPDCFRCDHCDRMLTSGDEYYLHGQNEIFCREDYQQLKLEDQSNGTSTAETKSISQCQSTSQPPSSKSANNSRKEKPRMRTVLTETQLLTLKQCYGANPRPDALMKERLVEMTRLSPRVIRVWFQNKRCKDKKRNMLTKQTHDPHKVLGGLNHGIPLIASSPVPNDVNVGLPTPSLVQIQYHPGAPWKGGYNSYSNGRYLQIQQQNYPDFTGFASEDDSTCFDASQLSEERSDTSCDGVGFSQLTLL